MMSVQAPSPGSSTLKKRLFFIVKALFAAALITVIVAKVNHRELLSALENYSVVWLAPAVLCYAVHIAVCTLRWHALVRTLGVAVSPAEIFSLCMQGYFFSMFLPGGSIGGDVVKAALISAHAPPGSKIEGAFSIFMDRWTGMVALFTLCPFVSLLSIGIFKNLQGVSETAAPLLVSVCVAGLTAGLLLLLADKIRRLPVLSGLADFADRRSSGAVSRVTAAVETYKRFPKTLILCVLAGIVFVHLNMGLCLFLILRGTPSGADASFLGPLCAISVGNTAAVIPVTPSGIGARDFIVNDLLKASGVAPADALAATLLFTALVVGFNLVGGIFFALWSFRRPRKS
jgi:uncharacterized protein (TIRG00374 family)